MLGVIRDWVGTRISKGVVAPITNQIDENITDITTTIGSFVIRKIRDTFQRSITFSIGNNYANEWMEEALYGIVYEYNDIIKSSKLEIHNKSGYSDGSAMYYRLDDGVHNLKYRQFNILLIIQTKVPNVTMGRAKAIKVYTVITYDLSPEFMRLFEKDMLRYRNSILKIRSDASTIDVYRDLHESDGYTYWEKMMKIHKRSLSSIYIPYEDKKKLVDTINNFFASKEFYHKHGIPWNLKILLYGEAGTGKSSIVKMIASEWNRNIFECTGGKNGRFIPEAITDNKDCIIAPLFSISDADKYSFLINEPKIASMDEDDAKEEKLSYKQYFGNMINALDGIISGEGRIIIMTTNHIEKFSPTLLRPGRIDLQMEITYVVPETFRKYVYDFYGNVIPKDIKLMRDNITIAEMQADIVFNKLTFEQFMEKYTTTGETQLFKDKIKEDKMKKEEERQKKLAEKLAKKKAEKEAKKAEKSSEENKEKEE